MTPAQIDEYRIVRELGAGGMGTVYEGIHVALSHRVAIKVVRPEYAHDSEIEQRFLKEAMALSRIVHPSVVKIHTFGFLADGTSYLVMEFLNGQSLAQRWQQSKKTLSLLGELRLLYQIADVLAVLHRAGVVHRDLKPENIMIVPDSDEPGKSRAKLVDFGLAKLIRTSGPHTKSALIMGTPAYMSPEQCRGAGLVDAKTDSYAFGVMLYELIVGSLPFESNWPGDLIGMHLHVEPTPISRYVPNIDARLSSLTHDLLIKQKEARPAMAEVVSRLGELLGASEPAGAPTSPRGEVDAFAPTDLGAPRPSPQVAPADAPALFVDPHKDTGQAPIRNPKKGAALSVASSAGNAHRTPAPGRESSLLRGLLVAPAVPLLLWSIYTIVSFVGEFRSDRSQTAAADSTSSMATMVGSSPNPKPEQSSFVLKDKTEQLGPADRISGDIPKLQEQLTPLIPCTAVDGSYEICTLPAGTVASVEPVISIPGADRSIMDTVATWRFPSRSRKQCFRYKMHFLVENRDRSCSQYKQGATASEPVAVPEEWLAENMRGGIYLKPTWPKSLKPLAPCQIQRANYQVCIDTAGRVYRTAALDGLQQSYAAADKDVMGALSLWRYRQLAFPVCVEHRLTFQGPDDQSCARGL